MPQGPQPFEKDRHKAIGVVEIGGSAEHNRVGLHQFWIEGFEIVVKLAQIVPGT